MGGPNLNAWHRHAEILADGIQPRGNFVSVPIARFVEAVGMGELVLHVRSTCDQALTIQAAGHESNSPGDFNGVIRIDTAKSLGVGNTGETKLAINFSIRDVWQPWLGCYINTGGTGPSAGSVSVIAHIHHLH